MGGFTGNRFDFGSSHLTPDLKSKETDMKLSRIESLLLPALLGTTLFFASGASAASVLLQFEESTDLKTWSKVPEGELTPLANGAIVRTTDNTKAFYRLTINPGGLGGSVPVLPLREAPAFAVDIAQSFLKDFLVAGEGEGGTDPEGNWVDVQLGPVCYPVYDPAVDNGKSPAYLEFKVVKRAAGARPGIAENKFDLSPPPDEKEDLGFGYILISLTRGDSPVVQFGDVGLTPVERLLRKVKSGLPLKPMRFDDGLLVAEGPAGEVLGSLGNAPFRIDPQVLEFAGKEFDGVVENGGEKSDPGPEFKVGAYDSYEDFKKDFVGNPFFQKLREVRADQVKREWQTVTGEEPTVVQLKIKGQELILRGQQIKSFIIDSPDIASVQRSSAASGLIVTGLRSGGARLDVVLGDGTTDTLLILVLGPTGSIAQLNTASTGWTSWSYWYAGSWSDQRRYSQFSNDSQMCPSGASGCGPTAWAMLYGWWDRKGSPRTLKNPSLADSPLTNDDSVRDCCRYVFNRVGTFCVSGQAATVPWAMKNGYKWGDARGAGYSISWTWGVPYLSPGSVGKARDSIQAGRPSIIGLGFYWHYPLAYGYKSRSYKLLGVTWDTQRYFKCNMGWGGSSPEWRNGSSVWFGTNGRYF